MLAVLPDPVLRAQLALCFEQFGLIKQAVKGRLRTLLRVHVVLFVVLFVLFVDLLLYFLLYLLFCLFLYLFCLACWAREFAFPSSLFLVVFCFVFYKSFFLLKPARPLGSTSSVCAALFVV